VGKIYDMVRVRGGVVVVHAEEHERDLLHSTVVKDNLRNLLLVQQMHNRNYLAPLAQKGRE